MAAGPMDWCGAAAFQILVRVQHCMMPFECRGDRRFGVTASVSLHVAVGSSLVSCVPDMTPSRNVVALHHAQLACGFV